MSNPLRGLAWISLLTWLTGPVLAAQRAPSPPPQFGNDWDDPRTAEPAIVRPSTQSCTVEIVRHGFANFDPYRATFTPPADCPGPWHKVVLDLEGAVKGRQYDRMGQIRMGGVTVLRTSTPEPSREGISWHVEKDVTAYAPLFAQPTTVEMELGNLVNDTYTGVFDIRATLTFYRTDAAHPVAATADRILPLDNAHRAGADLVGAFVLPADTRQLLAEVYANGSGGGCEEFWYLTAPLEGYSCRSEQGPYREVQVLVDGQVAGLAVPYPHIYTGGWSNPFLWYAIPAPHTFDLKPQQFDLSPFIGLLNDGKPHELRVRVIGLAHDAEGWTLLPNLQLWRDAKGTRVRGALTHHAYTAPAITHPLRHDASDTVLEASGRSQLSIAGWVEDSQGRRQITLDYDVSMHSQHRWTQDESNDRLQAEWVDRVRRSDGTATGNGTYAWTPQETTLRFGLDGGIRTTPVQGHPRLTTDLKIHIDEQHARGADISTVSNRFEGEAAYTQDVPREQRNATGRSRQSVEIREGRGGCEGRRIATVNGYFTEDLPGCAP